MNMKIKHFRPDNCDFTMLLKALTREGIRKRTSKNANGATSLSIVLPNRLTVTAWSVCSPRDSFTRKDGVYEALKKIAEAYPELEIVLPERKVKVKKPYDGPFAKKKEA